MSDTSQVSKHQLVDLYRQALLKGVSFETLESTIEKHQLRTAISKKNEEGVAKKQASRFLGQLPLLVRIGGLLVPFGFIGLGLFLLGSATLPIFSYYFTTLPYLSQSDLLSPVPRQNVLDVTPLVIAQAQEPAEEPVIDTGPVILDTKLDYTNLANWFSDTQVVDLNQGEVVEYILDIPEVDIANAVVKVGGTDLNGSLIQYPGTASPGEFGAPVIFGHSVLRQFYNPSEKNTRRYTSIFSYIMTLKPGDKIYLTRDKVKYTYIVREKTEVKPEDVHILTQNYSTRQLKLVTCTPEGTYLRRGVVTAELISE